MYNNGRWLQSLKPTGSESSGQSLSVQGSSVGVDTLKLRLVDYEVAPDSVLKVRQPDYTHGTGEEERSIPLFRDTSGYLVEGVRAYHNAEDFNLSFSPLTMGDDVPVGAGCWVQLSVPKRARGENYHPVSGRSTRTVLRKLESSLREVGVRTNIETAQLVRLDTFRNVVADEPFPSYHPVFSLLSAKRMPKRDYGTTFLWHNTRQEVCVYDKLEEMQHRKLDTSHYPQNTIRFEHRLLKGKKIREALGFSSVKDLCDGYGHVAEVFKQTMREQLFRYSVADFEVLTKSRLKAELALFRDRYGRNWLQYFFQAQGFLVLADLAGVDVLKQAIAEVAGDESETDKKRIRRVVQRVERMRFDLSMAKIHLPSRRKLAELYTELETKLLAA
jgi:hypothetical protein